MNLSNCPICSEELLVNEYHCPSCEISFKGEFTRNWLEGFSSSQLEFIAFPFGARQPQGMQNRLGISYPTVKSRLSEIVSVIADEQEKSDDDDFSDILGDLESGFIDVEGAVEMINKRREQ